MNLNKLLWCCISAFATAFSACGQTNAKSKLGDLTVFNIDPLVKVLRTDIFDADQVEEIAVAKGEAASIQFVIRSRYDVEDLSISVTNPRYDRAELKTEPIRYVGYVKVGTTAKDPSKDRLKPTDKMFPDPLITMTKLDIPANNSQPIWVTIPVSANTAAAIYKGTIVFKGKANGRSFTVSKNIVIRVFNVTIGKNLLSISLWPSDVFNLLNGGKKVPRGTDTYWRYTSLMANMMAKYRQNVVLVYPLVMTKYGYLNGKYTFDFSDLDKIIDIYRKAGVIGKIEGGFPGGRKAGGGWDASFEFYYYVKEGSGFVERMASLDNNDVQIFYSQFIPAFVSHLKEKNLYDAYYQHIADEPTDKNYDSYLEFYKFIKKLAPDLKTIDAVQTLKVADKLDIVVPQLDQLANNWDYYVQLGKKQQIWFYTCWQPQGEYANRFIEQPLLKTRYIHWLNYKLKASGYLHWAYNHWDNNPFGESSKTLANKETLPGGDSWIIYPSEGGLNGSLRLEAMRDGICDFELLRMLEKKYPNLVATYLNEIVYDVRSYNMDISMFRNVRKKVLELLAK